MSATHSRSGHGAVKARLTWSNLLSGAVPGTVVRGPVACETPGRPGSFINRWVVHRATGLASASSGSRASWAWTLRIP